jgi:Tol biopolymer transport system component
MAGGDGGAGLGADRGWRWDVALSFAGAQRPYVEQVAAALQARGLRCFYDADEQIELWGRYLAEELPRIYAEESAAVVVFVSADYADRDWTRLERRAALDRAVRERREYVLPARFDDTPLPGLLAGLVAVDLRGRAPQQFGDLVAAKLASLAAASPGDPRVPGGPPPAGRPPAEVSQPVVSEVHRPVPPGDAPAGLPRLRAGAVTVIEVAIGPGGVPGVFKVEVLASPAGEASAVVGLDADSLLARRGLLQQAVLASAVPSRRVLPETEQPVREVGEVLFAGLLGAGEVAGRYRAAAVMAAERDQGLRVVLRIDDPVLAGLPWEAMYDRAAGAYVCRQDQLVRHVPVAPVPAPLRVAPPLRILGVVSSPRGLPALDVEKEQEQLARALARPVSQGLAKLHWAPSATWADLQDLLLDGEWHVLHFIGHGDFDPGRAEGVLALTREDGRADLVAAHRLVDLLRQARPVPRLVVLNSCSGAAAGTGDLFSGTAAALVRGGVSAVAAMQYEISDPAAVAFARGFYAAIARGRGVDDAVSSGRVAILGTGDRTLEWVTPVLYLRGHDTRLFTLPAPADDAEGTGRQGGGGTRGGQPSSPGASGRGPDRDSPADRAGTRAPQPVQAPVPPSRLARTLTGHTGNVYGVAFSPDGQLLATASWDQTARVWDPATGEHLRTLTGHTGYVCGVAFSPDGRLLATASWDQTARVWDPATGGHLRTLTGHTGYVWGVAFSPDGRLLATASGDKTARVWDPATGGHLRTLTGHTGYVCGVAFSPDGRLLATASGDKTARVWDPATGGHLRTLTGHTSPVLGVAFSPDGRLLATASGDKTARVWDPATGGHLRTLTRRAGWVLGVAFSPDGRLLATASGDKTARVWDPATGQHLRTLAGRISWLRRISWVRGVAFSPDGRLLATASDDEAARVWD